MEEYDQVTELDHWKFSRTNNDYGHLYKQSHGYGAWRRQISLGRSRSDGDGGTAEGGSGGYRNNDNDEEMEFKAPPTQGFGLWRQQRDRSFSTRSSGAPSVEGNTTIGNTTQGSTTVNDYESRAEEALVDHGWEERLGTYDRMLQHQGDDVSQLSDDTTRGSIPEEVNLLTETFVAPLAYLHNAIEVSFKDVLPNACDCGHAGQEDNDTVDGQNAPAHCTPYPSLTGTLKAPTRTPDKDVGGRTAQKPIPGGLLFDLLPHINQVMGTSFEQPENDDDCRLAENRSPTYQQLVEAKEKNMLKDSDDKPGIYSRIRNYFSNTDDTKRSQSDEDPQEAMGNVVKAHLTETAGNCGFAIEETNSLIEEFVEDHVHYFHNCVDRSAHAQAPSTIGPLARDKGIIQEYGKLKKNKIPKSDDNVGTASAMDPTARGKSLNRWNYEVPHPTEAQMLEIAGTLSDTSLGFIEDMDNQLHSFHNTVTGCTIPTDNFSLQIRNFDDLDATTRKTNQNNVAENGQTIGQKKSRRDDDSAAAVLWTESNDSKRRKIEFTPLRYIRQAMKNFEGDKTEESGKILKEEHPLITIEENPYKSPIIKPKGSEHDKTSTEITSNGSQSFRPSEKDAPPQVNTNTSTKPLHKLGEKKDNSDVSFPSEADDENMLDMLLMQMDSIKVAIGSNEAMNDLQRQMEGFNLMTPKPAEILPETKTMDEEKCQIKDSQGMKEPKQALATPLHVDGNISFAKVKANEQLETNTIQTRSESQTLDAKHDRDTSSRESKNLSGMRQTPNQNSKQNTQNSADGMKLSPDANPLPSGEDIEQSSDGLHEDPVIEIMRIVEDPHNPRYQSRRKRTKDSPSYKPKGLLRKLKNTMKKSQKTDDEEERKDSSRSLEEWKLPIVKSSGDDDLDAISFDEVISLDYRGTPHSMSAAAIIANKTNGGHPSNANDQKGKKNVVATGKAVPFEWETNNTKLANVASSVKTMKAIPDKNIKTIDKRASVDSKSKESVELKSSSKREVQRKGFVIERPDDERLKKHGRRLLKGYVDDVNDNRNDKSTVAQTAPINQETDLGGTHEYRDEKVKDDSSTQQDTKHTKDSNLPAHPPLESREKYSTKNLRETMPASRRDIDYRNPQSPPPWKNMTLDEIHRVWKRSTSLQQGSEQQWDIQSVYGEEMECEIQDEDPSTSRGRLGIDPFAPQHNVVLLHASNKNKQQRQGVGGVVDNQESLDWNNVVTVPPLERHRLMAPYPGQLSHPPSGGPHHHHTWTALSMKADNNFGSNKVVSNRAEAAAAAQSNTSTCTPMIMGKRKKKGLFGKLRTVVCKPRDITTPAGE